MKLSNEQEHLVLDNQKLVYYIISKLGVTKKNSDYEDLVSIGTIGLIKAATTFNTSKKFNFSTYAIRCIKNEILLHYRRAKKHASDVSINEPIGNNNEITDITLGDIIADTSSDFVEKVESKEEFINLLNIALNSLRGYKRIALLYLMANTSQQKIATKMNISQSYVSKIEEKAIIEIKEFVKKRVPYKEVFFMEILGDEYRISFLSRDVNNFNKIFARLLKNLTSVEDLPNFKVNCNKERIIIQIPAEPESFSFIAEIIQEIDNFSISFTSDKSIKGDEKEIDVIQPSEQVKPIKQRNESDERKPNSTIKKEKAIDPIRKYFLTLTSFTIEDLRKHFPNIDIYIINNAVYSAKKKGLITAISRGTYVVNKS